MMEFMSEWMRGLILVIFLAVFLDMVLPNNKMQRYVKVVMGLLVILMMMSPVLKLFGTSVYEIDFNVDRMFEQAKGEQMMAGLEAIQAQSAHLQESTQSQVVDQWKSAITEAVRTSLEDDYPVKVGSVEVGLSLDPQGQPQALTGLTIKIGPNGIDEGPRPIETVEPVVIGGSTEPEPVHKRQPLPAAVKEHMTAIQAQLANEYSLTASQVNVVWQES